MYSSVTLDYSVRPPEKSVKEMDEVTRQIPVKRGLGIAITEGLRIIMYNTPTLFASLKAGRAVKAYTSFSNHGSSTF